MAQLHEQDNQQEIDRISPEDRIRMRAYYLWENAPDPKGTPDEYWEQARAEAEKAAEGDESTKHGVLPAPTPTPARKP
jgi:hypothetical protein